MGNGSFNINEDFIKVFESWTITFAIITAGLFALVKGIKKYKEVFATDNFITVHSEIHELLTELRVLTDAARTQVIQFHNGEYFMDGISMRKFSLTHESVEKGIESDGERMQGLLCSMFLPLLLLVVEDHAKVHFTVDLKDSHVRQYLESRNVEAFSVVPLQKQNQMTGFVMVQWCSGNKAENLDSVYCSGEIKKITDSINAQLAYQKR
jgi:transcriptional regulator with GAF, ATPase, and Fis domain